MNHATKIVRCAALGVLLLAAGACKSAGPGGTGTVSMVSSGILFVTQVPTASFGNVGAAFFNHTPSVTNAPRGGALMLLGTDGTLRNLTQEAGFGETGMQGANAIAVREPTVHWDGDKALFSMTIGSPLAMYKGGDYQWQIYEVSGLTGKAPAAIRKIDGQPPFNNVSPIYAADDRILFTSDRPRDGLMYHYPQLDEYESQPSTTGIWSLDEKSGTLTMLEHAPSGDFNLSIDSFGRIIFTRWDHLQRDQQGDDPSLAAMAQAFTYASEDQNAAMSTTIAGSEVFPEPRSNNDPTYDPTLNLHSFNQFFPWMLNEDGTGNETINHLGRHEFGGSYTDGNFVADKDLTYLVPDALHANKYMLRGAAGLFQLREDPKTPGRYYATFAPEFDSITSGPLIRLDAGPSVNPQDMQIIAVTPPESDMDASGHYRDPTPLSDGSLICVHTPDSGDVKDSGSATAPSVNYAFRLKKLVASGDMYTVGDLLTPGINVDVSWFTPDVLAKYSGPLWEMSPVEVRARTRPTETIAPLDTPEMSIFNDLGITPDTLSAWLKTNDLALIISRNVTQRDAADQSQPYNLRVPGGVEAIGLQAKTGTVYDIDHIQMFQADQLRGYGPTSAPKPGRRVLARPMHGDLTSTTPELAGAVPIAPDGSIAAFVPATRALTWQLTGPMGGVVRERNWVSFQAGEIRVCAACHGINRDTQTGETVPTNSPSALRTLLTQWQAAHPGGM